MSDDDLSKQIYNQLNLKETEELLEIWQTNNRYEWTDVAFAHIETILKERKQTLPVQKPATFEKIEDIDNENLKDWEIKLVEAENQPDFYDTVEVLGLIKWLDWAEKATWVIVLIFNVLNIRTFFNSINVFFPDARYFPLVLLITFVGVFINYILGVLLTVIILKTLSQVLRILMEMEFNSRKA